MNKSLAVIATVLSGLLAALNPAIAGQSVVIKGVLCTPYSSQGKTYPGCPNDPPPPQQDAYAAAKALGDMRTKGQFDTDCANGIALSSCAAPSTPHGCPEGRAWSLEGTAIAHCVDVGPHYCPPDAPNRSVSKDGLAHCY